MGRVRRTALSTAGRREATAIAARLGKQIREARRARRRSLDAFGAVVGLSPSRLSAVERGMGATLPLETWVRIGLAIDRPLAVRLTEPLGDARLADAGHLELQEWVLRVARAHGWRVDLEVPTRATDPRYSIDVVVRAGDRLLLFECWNTMRDFGAAVRSTRRKLAEIEELRVATGATTAHACWLVRPTAANREIVRRYPEAVRARFAGSAAWVQTLRDRVDPPDSIGFVWLDPATGVAALRLRAA